MAPQWISWNNSIDPEQAHIQCVFLNSVTLTSLEAIPIDKLVPLGLGPISFSSSPLVNIFGPSLLVQRWAYQRHEKRGKCTRLHCWPQCFSLTYRQTLAMVSWWVEWISLPLDFRLGHVTCFGEWYLDENISVTISSLTLNRPCMFPFVLLYFYHHHEMNMPKTKLSHWTKEDDNTHTTEPPCPIHNLKW